MEQFLVFVKKECLHILRDRRTLFILFGMPIVQIVIFGFALSNEVKNSTIAILDPSKDAASLQLTERFEASKYFDIQKNLNTIGDIEKSFREGKIKMAIVFPENFREDLLHTNKAQIQFISDASDPNIGTTLINYANAILGDYQNELSGQNLPYTIKTEVRMLYNPQLKAAFNFVPGVMAMVLMLVCTMMTSISIVKEKEMGTMEVLLVSPLRPILMVVSKAIPYLFLSIINISTILLLSVYVLEVPIQGSLFLLMAESTLFIITSLALGLLISAGAASQQTAMFISLVGLFMPTLVFSGFMFPIDNMPIPLQVISNVVPAKWFFYIVKSIMIKGLGFKAIWKETLILFGMTIFLLAISIKKFKIRLS
ncbi:MAG TPA: ABC transporter permease [Saprospiraceae bacterium]|nr:ABC transporter permease [Saprospiraceae bacterium]